MENYVYGVEKYRGSWRVWRFNSLATVALMWVLNTKKTAEVRWLCTRDTAIEMAGEAALEPGNLVDYGA